MSNVPNIYETIADVTETGVQYFFISKGTSNIIKAIQYSHALDFQDKKVYNLGFGDYDSKTNSIDDDVISNNGDAYRIFHTVLNTIPHFSKRSTTP